MTASIARTSADVLAWLQRQVPASAQLCLDSRAVARGDVFVAYAGARNDGRDHVGQALERGAAAVLFDGHGDKAATVLKVLEGRGVPGLAVDDLKSLLGATASAWYGDPSLHMTVIAVTGTNGKTSCTQWLADALTADGKPCGVIGTLGIRMPGTGHGHTATGLTTPDAVALHRALADMRAAGAVAVAIEASSIGIAEGRLDGLNIDVAVLTNLTRDHLDYHGDMVAYEAQKARLFRWQGLSAVVVNLDDPAGLRILDDVRDARHTPAISTAGFTLRAGDDAALRDVRVVRAADLHAASQGMVFTLVVGDRPVQIATPLLGEHNVANLLAVAGVLLELGWPTQRIAGALASAQAAQGRLEAVAPPGRPAGRGVPLVVVDYAHSPDALDRVLQALGPVAQARGGRRICLFGCGGDRDAGKRPQMAQVAQDQADELVVTSDNPRSEAPQAIIDQILSGLHGMAHVRVEIDRARAIREAILSAAPGDVVLLAGKGHEAYQEIAGARLPFSDVAHARAALADYPISDVARGMMTLADAAAAVGGVLHADPSCARVEFLRVGTDSRNTLAGDLFVALVGERFDAHDYLAAVAADGAVGAIVQRPVDDAAIAQIVVPDTRAALGRLAGAWRGRFAIPLIGVTGSNGKTTTKEMIAAILAAWQGDDARLATRGNLNNEIGVPLTLLRLTAEHRCAVLELGMNHPGEIAQLAHMAGPTVGMVNNAQREHQEFMHTVEAVARENGAVIESLPADGVAVFPGDDPHTAVWAELAGARAQLRFGLSGSEDVTADNIRLDAFEARFRLVLPTGSADIALSAAGLHNVRNALAASACAFAIGVPIAVIVQGLQAFAPVKGRMQRHALADGALLIDDTYNANPDSARAAIDVLAGLPRPRVLVLGDMGEVGNQGPAMHREIGEYARERGIDALFTLGDATAETTRAFAGPGLHADAVESIAPAVLALKPASVLVKGSRFMRMERVVSALNAGTGPSVHSSHGTPHAA